MRLLPSDPDVRTIINRIASGDIDLQPEFQRGEVWSRAKKQRLIDSILRDWHVPPIHVIENPKSRKQEVLDGQQRLAAIRDFVHGLFPVDGAIEPTDASIANLNGTTYDQLPESWRRHFDQFTIRVFRIIDYHVTEPAELFFRLNQPASLTGAEQRNAFFGPVREQIKELVATLEEEQLNKGILGFSNARMSYDDVLSRTALAVERSTIAEKITSGDLTQLYRSEEPLRAETISFLEAAIKKFAGGLRNLEGSPPKFNKATLFSWLIFLIRLIRKDADALPINEWASFLAFFHSTRDQASRSPAWSGKLWNQTSVAYLFSVYDSRSSSRVADVSSVILRDAVIWFAYDVLVKEQGGHRQLAQFELQRIQSSFASSQEDDHIARRLIDSGWGEI